jgi:hypothetical protein
MPSWRNFNRFSTMKDIEQTVEILKVATADIRAAYVTRYTDMELFTLRHDRAELAKVGMDAKIYAPFPSGNMDRKQYRRMENDYRRVRCYFRGVKGCISMHDPEIVAEKPDSEVRLRAQAKQEADATVDSYLLKLAGKIGKLIISATTNGNIWDYATLNVVCADGEKQTWRTNCILNQSVYRKLFNQWPTRRVTAQEQVKPLLVETFDKHHAEDLP